jgi:hypothetical protein
MQADLAIARKSIATMEEQRAYWQAEAQRCILSYGDADRQKAQTELAAAVDARREAQAAATKAAGDAERRGREVMSLQGQLVELKMEFGELRKVRAACCAVQAATLFWCFQDPPAALY